MTDLYFNSTVFIFGNGSTSFSNFCLDYCPRIEKILDYNPSFIVCDFKGVDTLVMEFLKTRTDKVTVCHIGDKPRYLPDKYKTKVSEWHLVAGFINDLNRDTFAIEQCTHFIATDFTSNDKRVSGTSKNITTCLQLGKIKL